MEQYKKPEVKVISTECLNVLCSSGYNEYRCDKYCRIWHICQDRHPEKCCIDKKY